MLATCVEACEMTCGQTTMSQRMSNEVHGDNKCNRRDIIFGFGHIWNANIIQVLTRTWKNGS